MGDERGHPDADPAGGFTEVRTLQDLAAMLRRLRLRQARAVGAHRVSYRALAKRAGWSHTIVGGYLTGTSLAPADRFDELVRLLGASPAEQGALATARDRVEELRRGTTAAGTGPAARAVPRQLPADVAGFTGRDAELARLDALLRTPAGQRDGVVIVSVTGTAGVGKTSLVVHAAHRWRGRFSGGQLYVDLRGYDPGAPLDPHEALAALLGGLGVSGTDLPLDTDARAARFRSETADRRLLIVLDNAGTVEQVRPLLPGTTSCVVLVTSRDSLAGLVARHGATRLDLDLLPAGDADRLLRGLIGARVDAAPEVARLLAERCARLPLALRVAAELAVARPSTPLALLAAELADERRRLDLLDGGGDSRADVRAVFSWSLRQLSEPDARVFGLLGPHPHVDFDEYAAAALAGCPVREARAALDRLARKHLVRPLPNGRYGMHDLLRAYAMGLSSVDAVRSATDRLLDHYLATACTAMDVLFPAEAHRRPRIPRPATDLPELAGAGAALAWLDAERACLVAAARHAAAHDRPAHAVRLSATLFRYLCNNYADDSIVLHRTALAAAERAGDQAGQAEAHNGLGITYLVMGRGTEAIGHLERALALSHDLADHAGEGRAAAHIGVALTSLGEYAAAIPYHEQSVDAHRRVGYTIGEGRALNNLGTAMQRVEGPGRATGFLEAALGILRRAGDRDGEAIVLVSLGEGELQRDPDLAGRYFREAVDLFGATRNRFNQAYALDGLGRHALRLGRHAEAAACHREALDLFREVGERNDGIPCALNGLGETALADGHPEEALAEHGAALEAAIGAGCRDQSARAHVGLGLAHSALGDPEIARDHWAEALEIYDALGLLEAGEVRARLTALDAVR